jgi:metal-responsive CopG/Arc/MetJ family transcriptional regulator
MPNKPRPENRHRMVRVEDDLWEQAGRAAAEAGTTRSEVMREALRAFVHHHGKERKP